METSVTDGASVQRRFRLTPGWLVVALGLLLVGVVALGAGLSLRARDGGPETTTIATLRADPLGYDDRRVRLEGQAEDIRSLPYLDQYAIYTFRDTTGSLLVLTRHGAPPEVPVRLEGVFHSRVTLDEELRRLAEEELGSLAGVIISALLPDISVNAVFLEHQRYEPLS